MEAFEPFHLKLLSLQYPLQILLRFKCVKYISVKTDAYTRLLPKEISAFPILPGGKMYVIIVYDVGVDRINNIRKFLKRFLIWIQNSVFEGEITESQLIRIENYLNKNTEQDYDFIKIYILSSNKYLKMDVIGTIKKENSNII